MAAHDDEALRLFEQEGLSYEQIKDRLGLRTVKQVNHAIWRARKVSGREGQRQVDVRTTVLTMLRKGEYSTGEISEKTDRSTKTISDTLAALSAEGYGIHECNGRYSLTKTPQEENKTFIHNWRGEILRFGVISDTHLCSKYCRMDHLSAFYDDIQAEGIDTVYHAGDVLDGDNVYRGHRYEVDIVGSDAQVDYVVQNYPYREGVKTRFITGNHDLQFFKEQGRDVGRAIAAERPDMEYLGQLGAYVNITKTLRMYLLHPDSGPAYAISYKPQRIAAGFFGGEKPAIMIIGHYHQAEYLFERNIHIIQAGSWQGQTPYLRRKGIWPKVGGWIVEIGITKEGKRGDCISSIKPILKVHVI